MRMTWNNLTTTVSALAIAAAVAAYGTATMAHDGMSHGAPEGVAQASPAASADGVVSVVRAPTDLPAPIAKRGPQHVKVDLETVEVTGQLDNGTTYNYWTFNRKVPGPLVRVRVGDTVEVTMRNDDNSTMMHNVDFHAVTGPGGGGMATEAAPGEAKSFVFKALNPGVYVYHCATPMVAQHISNGMYGLIVVEPAEGLPKVDREFYVMQGELYTEEPIGTQGEAVESIDKLLAEKPEYFVFNGAVGALSKANALKAKTGETIRIFFGVGGPNFTSSFHVIGEIFDKVYPLGSFTSRSINDVQTVTVPPGGGIAAEMKLEVPGTYVLVDHALSRVNKGLAGFLEVTGPENPSVFKEQTETKVTDQR